MGKRSGKKPPNQGRQSGEREREGERVSERERETEKKVWFKCGPRKRQETTFSPEPFTSIFQGKLEQVRGSAGPPTPWLMSNSQPPSALTHLSIGS